MRMVVTIKPTAETRCYQLIRPGGAAQCFHTSNVMRRMVKYMPMQTGALIKLMQVQTVISTGKIVVQAPQAKYLYYGKVMVNAKTGKGPGYIPNIGYRYRKGTKLRATTRPLKYTTTKHPLAGPFWDRRMWAAEGEAAKAELEAYINGGK